MEPEKKIARLAIGVEGGFNPDANKKRYEYEEHNSVVILPGFDTIPLPNPELPEIVRAVFYIQLIQSCLLYIFFIILLMKPEIL